MQQLTMTRRSFVKASIVAGAALALSTKLSGSSFTKTDKAFAIESSGLKCIVTTCHGCIQVCFARAYVQDNVVVKLEGHPLAPQNLGSMCLKGLSQLHTCYSPRRVLYPIKRSGARGAENMAWERLSWDEACELCGQKIFDAFQKYGTYSFFTSVGGGGSYSFGQATSMSFGFGAPNVYEPGCAQCYLPRVAIANYMYNGADQSVADSTAQEYSKGLSPYERKKGVINDSTAAVFWGAQPSVSQTAQSGRAVAELRDTPCKTVVVDPNMSPDAVKADVWIRLRAATDGAMALCWIRYVIDKKLYDETFCKTWTNLPFIIDPDTKLPIEATDVWPDYVQETPLNTPAYVCYDNKTKELQPFEYLSTDVDPELFWTGQVNGKTCRTAFQIYKETAEPWTLARTEDVCWVPADTIEKGIRIYTDAPTSGIYNGVPCDMMQISSQVPLGLMGLDMMMGYVNKPGCSLTQTGAMPATTSGRVVRQGGNQGYNIGATEQENLDRYAAFQPGMAGATSLGYIEMQLQIMLDRLGMKNHKGLYHWSHSHIPSVLEAVKTGVPYKPRIWYDFSGNKMAMVGNSGAWYNAFDQIDWCMCQYPNLTSFQAEVADIVFPVMEWLEAPFYTRTQLNYRFPTPQIIHLGETVSNNVAPLKVQNAANKKLNDYMKGGGTIVFGMADLKVGAGPASPSPTSTNPTGSEKQTSNNSTYVHERFPDRYDLPGRGFPITQGGVSGVQEDSIIIQSFLDNSTPNNPNNTAFGAGLSYEQFLNSPDRQQPDFDNPVDTRFVTAPENYWNYGQHLVRVNDGLLRGFGTRSRKCEVYCEFVIRSAATGYPYVWPRLQAAVDISIGQEVKDQQPGYEYVGTYSPICQHIEPIENPIPGNIGYDAEYPLVISSGRVYYFHHGTMRHAPFIRELYPVPDVRMHPETAKKYGLKHMDWVKVSSRRATITGRVYETRGQDPGALWMERFWNPECFDNAQTTRTGGWRECNINAITKNSAPYNEVFGSYTNRGFTVKIEKGTRPDRIWVEPKEFAPFLPGADNQYVAGVGSLLSSSKVTPNVTFSDWTRT